ncbi:MAG: hypothetical protein OEV45_08850 [Desulfobacteraceae bacterium]|nr:hypothetical protein [Desulfobacteraceae bacterium]
MTSKIESLFLTYANMSLRNNPKNLLKIFKDITGAISFEPFGDYMDLIEMTIHNIVEFGKFDTQEIAKEKLEYLSDLDSPFPKVMSRPLWIDCAFESVFGYLLHNGRYEWELFYDSCGSNCFHKEERIAKIGKEHFVGEKRLKCYECDQLFFINIIDQISKRKEYSEIKEFYNLLRDFRKTVKWSVDIVNDMSHSPFKDRLVEGFYVVPDGFYELIENPFMESEGTQELFKSFIYSSIGYSLILFLLNNDRRKLKICERCEEFYVQTKLNPRQRYCKKCSPKSKMSKERRNEFQRKYRQKKKQEKLAQERKARIKNLVNKGWTREEAEEIINADSMM